MEVTEESKQRKAWDILHGLQSSYDYLYDEMLRGMQNIPPHLLLMTIRHTVNELQKAKDLIKDEIE